MFLQLVNLNSRLETVQWAQTHNCWITYIVRYQTNHYVAQLVRKKGCNVETRKENILCIKYLQSVCHCRLEF